ncbi:MAG: hypothetical protein WC314_04700 [Vulcanimicrobiota bacterium]
MRSKQLLPAAAAAKPREVQLCPFHALRTDLALLLGASGTQLLENTWETFQLSPSEKDPKRLRPCLMKLFSVAARIAATKGVGHALKRLVTDFEKAYFPVVDAGAKVYLPALEQDPTLARRQFLFEAAYRAKSWSDAYRQARILKAQAPASAPHRTVNRRLGRVFDGLMIDGCSRNKKKQILTDLASFEELAQESRINFALDALASRATGCFPGEPEKLALELIPPSDPWWRVSLNGLYRHLAVPNRWADDLQNLTQAEETLRGFCTVVLNILSCSGARAQTNLVRNGLKERCFQVDANQARARLARVREAVREWQTILPPIVPKGCGDKPKDAFELTPEQSKFLEQVCHILEIEPTYSLTMSPDFFQCSEPEQRFLLARAVFRKAGGLDLLAQRASALATPQKILARAIEYAEWSGHEQALLDEFRDTDLTPDLVCILLQEVFWLTDDPIYHRLAVICHQGGWCPLFDREADLFAAGFADLVSASHGLVKATFQGEPITRACAREGLNSLLAISDDCPDLCLRLQTLWLSVADDLQRESPNKVLG